MKTISVLLKGKEPGILLHNPAGMQRKDSKRETQIPSVEEEAEASCYRDEKGYLAFPADNVKTAMIITSSMYKVGKTRISPFVAGSVFISPRMLSFGVKKYQIDTRRAVVQKQGILRSRANLPEWELAFEMTVDDDFPVEDLSVLRRILEEAGRRVGIGDFRPQKKGWFGKFSVEKFEFKK